MRDPHTNLGKALLAKLGQGGVEIRSSSSRAWASVTFSGARHIFTLTLTGSEATKRAQEFAGSITWEEFEVARHLVADIIVTHADYGADFATLTVEALTVKA
ncbi:MAG: hypothetical protein ABL918_06520 [Chakrabartia sp.]